MHRVVVVGGGLAALRACEGLRSRGYRGDVTLVGDERHAPYDRPPLSKRYLAGDLPRDSLDLRRPADLSGLGVTMLLGAEHRAAHLDVRGRELVLASGERLGFDGLVIATGSRARVLPGLERLEGTLSLRTIEDSSSLRSALAAGGARLLVIGGGLIGMEVAATARSLQAEVTVVEPLEVPLSAALGPVAGRAVLRMHEARGVRMRLGTAVDSLSRAEPPAGPLTASLSDGSSLEADAVLVAVGAAPNVEWLEGSGLRAGPGGIECTRSLEASPGVVVAGDVARWPIGEGPETLRVEHRTNAAEQGGHAAGTLLGADEPFSTVPYVWSDQYDVKIQLLGVPQAGDECVVVEGSEESGRLLALYRRGDLLSAAVAFSMPRRLMQVRPALARGTRFTDALDSFGSAAG